MIYILTKSDKIASIKPLPLIINNLNKNLQTCSTNLFLDLKRTDYFMCKKSLFMKEINKKQPSYLKIRSRKLILSEGIDFI